MRDKPRAIRYYRNGSSELVMPRRSVKMSFPDYPVIREILEKLQKSERIDPKLGYKLGVLCLKRLRHENPELFGNCADCFFADICAYPRNPEWFHTKLKD